MSTDAGVRMVALPGIPEVRPGDDLGALIADACVRDGQALHDGAAIVVAQKIVSKAEERVVALSTITPSAMAGRFARQWGKDARLVELALRQARRIVKMDRGVLIVETHHGLICANGGVDASNIPGGDHATLLPEDPDRSARRLRDRLREITGAACAVVIADTFGRPWREGLTNVAIGVAGFRPLTDERGRPDREGRTLAATLIATADEIAAAAGLLMGKRDGTPVVLVYGARLEAGEGTASELIRPPDRDLFR